MKESQTHQNYIAYLVKVNVGYLHSRTDKRTTVAKGEFDFVVFRNGRLMFLEFKEKYNKPSEDQLKRKAYYESVGCLAIIAYSLEEAIHATATWLGEEAVALGGKGKVGLR